ncbi:MAG: hypothetical protein KDB79_14950 [Acidobacteria bacterium]|nr:hypothetical protein [Acidobacteriota bacterium]
MKTLDNERNGLAYMLKSSIKHLSWKWKADYPTDMIVRFELTPSPY